MPSRFYIGSVATPAISPNFDAAWEQTGQAVRRKLFYKRTISTQEALTTSTSVTIPITTTQDILVVQCISDPLPRRVRLDNRNISMVIGRTVESATTANAHLAYSMRVLSNDGATVRGTVGSSFTTIVEFPIAGAEATRIIAATPATPVTIQEGDRLCLEIGIRAAAPTAAGSGSFRLGFGAASDFALTSGLTTDLNGWFEFAQDLFATDVKNYQHARADSGISVSEKIR